jgi:MFS family permease
MTGRQSRALTGLAMIYALRTMGLYMVLPVLSIYALSLRGTTPFLTGFALGAYGLTQAIFQIPLGHLSDRIGRKGVITIGLLIFAAGSVIASLGQHVLLLIVGRALQGTGAVASAVVALAADLTPGHARTQAMARLGVWLGMSLALGLVAGPAVSSVLGVPALFLATAALSILGIIYLQVAIPEPRHARARRNSGKVGLSVGIVEQAEGVSPRDEDEIRVADLRSVLTRAPVLLLCIGAFLLHVTLTALLVIMPVRLTEFVDQETLSLILAPTVAVALTLMFLSARVADRHRQRHIAFILGSILLVASGVTLSLTNGGFVGSAAGVTGAILALVLLEPLLSALISQHASHPHRGTAIGVYHMSLFLGGFVGGPLGGLFLSGNIVPLFVTLAVATGLWALLALRIQRRFFYPASV